MSKISSNFFLSDLSNALLNGFHSASSIPSAILEEGIVLPIDNRRGHPNDDEF
jgi:hypothetical protein